jgi:hypothetical protein
MRGMKYIGAVFLLLLLITLGFELWRPSPSIRVSIAFLGYNHDARVSGSSSGAAVALFGITNESAVIVRRYGTVRREWQHPPGHLQVYNTNYVVLGPGQSQVANVLVFTNRGAWRTVFHFAREGDPIATSPLVPVTLHRVILHQVPSAWISP